MLHFKPKIFCIQECCFPQLCTLNLQWLYLQFFVLPDLLSASFVVWKESYWMLVFSDVALCRYRMSSFMEFLRHLRKVTRQRVCFVLVSMTPCPNCAIDNCDISTVPLLAIFWNTQGKSFPGFALSKLNLCLLSWDPNLFYWKNTDCIVDAYFLDVKVIDYSSWEFDL